MPPLRLMAPLRIGEHRLLRLEELKTGRLAFTGPQATRIVDPGQGRPSSLLKPKSWNTITEDPICRMSMLSLGPRAARKVRTQAEAAAHARLLGHHPLCARVRHTYKGDPDHWRSCS